MKKFSLKIMLLLSIVSIVLSALIILVSIISITNLKNSATTIYVDALNTKHDTALKYQTEIASGVLKNNFFKEQRGELSLEEAKKEAIREISQISFAGNGSFFILDDTGKVIYFDQKTVAQGENHAFFTELTESAKSNGFQGTFKDTDEIFSTANGEPTELARVYASYYQDFDWIIGTYEIINSKMTSFDNFELKIEKMNQSTIQFMLIVSIAFLVIVIFVAAIIGRTIAKQIIKISKVARKLAEGDLTQGSLQIRGRDEIHELASSVNLSIQGIRDIVDETDLVARKVYAQTEEADTYIKTLYFGTGQISETMIEVAKGVQRQAESIDSIRINSQRTLENIQDVNKEMLFVEQSSEATEEVVMQGRQTIEVQKSQMDKNRKATEQTLQSIRNLESISEEIADIVRVIEGISSQTTLLALNASIEAARAGEQGKGFAVVANEIRKLAEETVESTSRISTIIEHVNISVNQSVQSMEVSGKVVKEQGEALEETEVVFNKIVKSASDTYQSTIRVKERTEILAEEFQNINCEIAEIASVAEETSAATEEVTATTEEQNTGFDHVKKVLSVLNEMSDELLNALRRFTI